MEDITRKGILLQALWTYWNRHHHLRLGQLLYNVVAPEKPCPELFYIEDRELLKLLENEI